MTWDPVKNFAKVIVNGYISSTDTQITLALNEGNKLPDPATDGEYNMVIWNATDYADPSDDPYKEIVRVTAKSGDVLTISRGQEGTSAQNHNITGKTYKMLLALTAKTYEDLQKTAVKKDGTLIGKEKTLNFIGFSEITDDSVNEAINIKASTKFAGDGSDGNLIISSGTTTIDLQNQKIFIKNYEELKITSTAKINFINPHEDGTLIIFRVKEDCVLTSTANPAIDLRNLGGDTEKGWFLMAGGKALIWNGSSASTFQQTGGGGASAIKNGVSYDIQTYEYVDSSTCYIKGTYGGSKAPFYLISDYIPRFYLPLPGGGGANGKTNAASGTNGTGGRGAGGLLIEVGGNLTTNSSFVIEATGTDGTAGTDNKANGGGGAGGSILIVYNGTKTGDDPTFNVAGGKDGANNTSGADGMGLVVSYEKYMD